MALFLALQVCTMACVIIAIDGHVIIAVNLEDFRNLATKFLSKDLADKLTNLVSDISLDSRKDIRNKANRSDRDYIEFAEVMKHKNINETAPTQPPNVKVTNVTTLKRFKTKSNKQSFGQTEDDITLPGPVYEKDELEDLLKSINEGYSNNDNSSRFATKLGERNENMASREAVKRINSYIDSKEETRERYDNNLDGAQKKIDYTETKLGDWRYNHVMYKKPVKIKNTIETGNADGNRNEKITKYVDNARQHEFPNIADHVKNVQYLDETRLLARKYKDKKVKSYIVDKLKQILVKGIKDNYINKLKVNDQQVDNRNTLDEYIISTKQKDSPKRKPHKAPIEKIERFKKQQLDSKNKTTHKHDSRVYEKQDLRNTNKITHSSTPSTQYDGISQDVKDVKRESKKAVIERFSNNSAEANQKVDGRNTVHKYILELKVKATQQTKSSKQPIEDNVIYEKKSLESQIKINNSNEKDKQSGEDKQDEQILRNKHEPYHHNNDESEQSSNNENLLLRKKKTYLDFKGPKSSEENFKTSMSKGFAAHLLPHLEDKTKTHKLHPEDLLKDSEEVNSNKHVQLKHDDLLKYSIEVREQSVDDHVMLTTKQKTGNTKPHKKQIEENDTYEKIKLSSEYKKSKKRKGKQLTGDNKDFKIPMGNENKFYDDEPSNIPDKKNLLSTNSKRFSTVRDSTYCERNPHSEQCVDNDVTTKSIARDLVDVSFPDTNVKKSGLKKGKNGSFSEHSAETKSQKVKGHDSYELGSKKKHFDKEKPRKLKIEENDMYEKYELGRETESDNERNYNKQKHRGIIKTKLDDNKKDHGNKEYQYDTEELPLKNKTPYKNEDTTKYKESKKHHTITEKAPKEGYADDPRPDFKDIKPESIKAKTESLGDAEEVKGKRKTKKFTMKGTIVPKRDFYKLSSPNYYKDLPRTVEKYDFDEPLPEQDRKRDEPDNLKRQPARINKKVKLTIFENP